MRIHIGAGLAIAALLLSVPSVSAQDRKDGGAGTEKGQSERPADPKHIEPESSSHNADKPKQKPDTNPTQQPSSEVRPPAPSTTPSKK